MDTAASGYGWHHDSLNADVALQWLVVDLHSASAIIGVCRSGGGFTSGSGGWDWYDGRNLAAAGGIVVVTANYRIGPLGYLYLPELGVENLGVQDQGAVLEWVKRNIAARSLRQGGSRPGLRRHPRRGPGTADHRARRPRRNARRRPDPGGMMDAAKLNSGRETLNLLISFGAGILAGLVFWLLREPAPAPPWPALIGLPGIVLGENLGNSIKSRLSARTNEPTARERSSAADADSR